MMNWLLTFLNKPIIAPFWIEKMKYYPLRHSPAPLLITRDQEYTSLKNIPNPTAEKKTS